MLYFKQIGCLVLCFMLLVLVACSSAVTILAENDRYKVVQENDKCYLVLKENINIVDSVGASSSRKVPHVTFDSFSEMKEDILSGNFTDSEWEEIEMLSYSQNGKIQLCDLDTLYQPIYPEEFEAYSINWFGPRYSFEIYGEEGAQCELTLFTKSGYEETINRLQNWKEYIVSEYDASQISVESETERNATVYYWDAWYGEIKNVIYTVEQNGNTFYVQEQYQLDTDSSLSDTIRIYGVVANQNFGVICNISKRPSVEWILSFGLAPYVENTEAE